MIASRILRPHPWLTAVLVFALFLAGSGRGWTAASGGIDAAPVIAGVAVHICHDGGSPVPDAPGHHDCCDLCALCAPVVLPRGPDLTAPARAIRYAAHNRAIGWAPIIARLRTPRLARGPPAA